MELSQKRALKNSTTFKVTGPCERPTLGGFLTEKDQILAYPEVERLNGTGLRTISTIIDMFCRDGELTVKSCPLSAVQKEYVSA
jgi:hypothetical protein